MDWVFRVSSPVMRALAGVALVTGFVFAAAEAGAQVERPDKRGSYYEVRIDSSPQGAALYLDDKEHGRVGETPWEGRLQQGEWTVILEKEGYERTEQPFRVVRTRELQEAFLTLDEEVRPAELTIDGGENAEGAEVLVDGEDVGEVPVAIEVPGGRHLVEVRKEGYEPFREWVSAEGGESVSISPELETPGDGQILVEADVGEAEVYLEGEEVRGELPLLIEEVPEGVHDVEVIGEEGISWQQRVEVRADETAEIEANLLGDEAEVRVLSDVDGAQVVLDGVEVGSVPLDLEGVRPGEHVVEVRAEGYRAREERIEVEPDDSKIVKLDLEPREEAILEIVSPVPDATVVINGERVGEVPQTREVSAGEHFVVVEKEGYQDFEEQVLVEQGEEALVTADLQAAGELRFISNPSGAEVYVDGQPLGVTPFTADEVAAGERFVTVRKPGYEVYEERVQIEGGASSVINATLDDAERTPAEIEREVRGLTSFAAQTLPPGRSTVDVAGGYPYFIDTRITVGAEDLGEFGFDAGVFLRTFIARTEVGVMGSLRTIEQGPFAAGAFAKFGGGGNFFDDSSRNTFFGDVGLVGSLSALRYVTISGRAYVNAYTDRHCPEHEDGRFPPDSDPVTTCRDYLDYAEGNSSGLSDDDVRRIDNMVSDPFGRDNGVRAMLSGVVEFAVEQRWNMWMVFEGAPFQESRAGYTSYFNRPMLDRDLGTYIRLGATLKF